jgi:hypothetical protein
MEKVKLTLTVSGTTATATSTRPIMGELYAVGVEYASGTNATTDLTLKVVGNDGMPDLPLLTVADNATSGWYYPRGAAVNTSNSAITNSFVCLPLHGKIQANVAQSTDTKVITVTLLYEG